MKKVRKKVPSTLITFFPKNEKVSLGAKEAHNM